MDHWPVHLSSCPVPDAYGPMGQTFEVTICKPHLHMLCHIGWFPWFVELLRHGTGWLLYVVVPSQVSAFAVIVALSEIMFLCLFYACTIGNNQTLAFSIVLLRLSCIRSSLFHFIKDCLGSPRLCSKLFAGNLEFLMLSRSRRPYLMISEALTMQISMQISCSGASWYVLAYLNVHRDRICGIYLGIL